MSFAAWRFRPSLLRNHEDRSHLSNQTVIGPPEPTTRRVPSERLTIPRCVISCDYSKQRGCPCHLPWVPPSRFPTNMSLLTKTSTRVWILARSRKKQRGLEHRAIKRMGLCFSLPFWPDEAGNPAIANAGTLQNLAFSGLSFRYPPGLKHPRGEKEPRPDLNQGELDP